MTDNIENSDVQDERSQLDVVDSFDIAELRRAAKALNIEARRDWDKADYISAIKAKQAKKTAAAVVFDTELGPKPGYARIVLHRDPMPGHKNSPVQVGVNGRLLSIPRGIEVDIPIPHVEALRNAKGKIPRMQQDANPNQPGGIYKDEEIYSYTFDVRAITPGGQFASPLDSRAVQARASQAFADVFGRYPTHGELQKWQDAKILKESK